MTDADHRDECAEPAEDGGSKTHQQEELNAASFPTAKVESVPVSATGRMYRSPVWLLTLVCAILALALSWHAFRPSGTAIVIHFPEGHGLRTGDAVRHRGIDIGSVTEIALHEDLSRIVVSVLLDEGAEMIAREDAQFWIVRPQIGLSGVKGLETAVGAKYIEVRPSRSTLPQMEFDGLAEPPADGIQSRGLQIVLRGEDRFGVSPGSPVTWRGIEVGNVLSSSLSVDALHVDTLVRIAPPHDRLVSRASRFWVTSGLQLDFGVSGFELTAQTLDTIARGGIAFITPAPSDDEVAIRRGHVFTLHAERGSSWLDDAAPVKLLQRDAPPIAQVEVTWQESFLGISRRRATTGASLLVGSPESPRLLLPKDLLEFPQPASSEDLRRSFQLPGDEPIDLPLDENPQQVSSLLTTLPLEATSIGDAVPAGETRFRTADALEDCFVVRRSGTDADTPGLVIDVLGVQELDAQTDHWAVSSDRFQQESWHGAVVLAASDEAIVGLLIVSDSGTQVALIDRLP